jgi:hypothetical protein
VIFAIVKPSTLLLLGVGGYVALRLFGLNKMSNQLTFAPGSIRVNRDGQKINITFGMDIDNPTPVQAKVNRTYGTVTDDKGNVIGTFNVPTYTVGANQVTRIQIPIVVQIGNVLKSILLALTKKTAVISINYTNEVGVLSVPGNYSFDLKKELNFPSFRDLTKGAETRENPIITAPL